MPSSTAFRSTVSGRSPGIDQQSPAIDFKQSRESPFSDATTEISRQHGGENSDFDGSGSFSRRKAGDIHDEDGDRDDRESSAEISHGQAPLVRFNLHSFTSASAAAAHRVGRRPLTWVLAQAPRRPIIGRSGGRLR